MLWNSEVGLIAMGTSVVEGTVSLLAPADMTNQPQNSSLWDSDWLMSLPTKL